jgi:hypothetical protein
LDEWKDITLFDNIEDAFVGVAERFGMGPVATYDYNKCIEIYMQDGMTLEEAVEYFNFNVIGLWAGDKTPVFVRFTT